MIKKVIKIFVHVLGVLIFVSATGYALLAAYGYQIDVAERNIVKTSIIDLRNDIDNVSVFLDQEFITDKTPFQIKNVKPGSHNLTILRPGYITWERKIIVEEDIATKINDVLLVPVDITKFSEKISNGFEYDNLIYNEEYLLLFSFEDNEIIVYRINNGSSFSIDNVNFKIDGFTKDLYFADTHRIVFSEEGNIVILDLRNNDTSKITIPDDFLYFQVVFSPELKGYYMKDNSIYSVDIGYDGSFQKISLIYEDSLGSINNFKVKSIRGILYFLIDDDLFIYANDEFKLLDNNVKNLPLASPGKEYVVYLKKGEEILLYSFYRDEKKLLARFGDVIKDILWYLSEKHILLIKNNTLTLCDIELRNCTDLLEVNEKDKIIAFPDYSKFLIANQKEIRSYKF